MAIGALALWVLAANTPSAAQWPTYRHDTNNSGAVAAHAVGALRLRRSWSYQAGSWVTSTPTVVGGLVYVGTWAGKVVALDAASGRARWSENLGANPDSTYGQTRGVISSVAVVEGVAYAVSGSCQAGAFDATSGRVLWRRSICSNARNDDTYASPVVADGLVLFGIDIMDDRPTDRGRIVALDAALGTPRWELYPERYTGTGTGISATPAIDPALGMGFVGTGNPTPRGAPPPGADLYSESIVAFDLHTGQLRWEFGPVHPHDALDRDLFASPNRFAVGSRWLIGEAGKDGVYYAVDERDGRPLWRTTLDPDDPYAQAIGTPAYGDGRIFVPMYGGAHGALVALSANDGHVLWRRQLAGLYEAPLLWGNAVFVTEVDGTLAAFEGSSGRQLLAEHLGGRFFGRGPSAVGSTLYVASSETVAAYALLTQ